MRSQTHTLTHSLSLHTHTPIKGGWGCGVDRTNTVLGTLPSEAIVQASGKETERKVWEGWGWRWGCFNGWLHQWVEIKGSKVLGQVEAWARWGKMVWRKDLDSQCQVWAGDVGQRKDRCVSCVGEYLVLWSPESSQYSFFLHLLTTVLYSTVSSYSCSLLLYVKNKSWKDLIINLKEFNFIVSEWQQIAQTHTVLQNHDYLHG